MPNVAKVLNLKMVRPKLPVSRNPKVLHSASMPERILRTRTSSLA